MSDKKFLDLPTEHPLEQVLNIEKQSTLVPSVQRDDQTIKPEHYDDKDSEIEQQFQEVYNAAMSAFEMSSDIVGTIEPKYRARNQEVALQYLNTALSAAREKASLKAHKDKLEVSKQRLEGSRVTNNTLIVADRNDILRNLVKGNEDQLIDGEILEDD